MNLKLSLYLTGLIVAVFSLCIFFALTPGQPFGSFGTGDFIAYWSAYAVYLHGGNPYDAAAILHEQQALGRTLSTPWMVWNPPWIFALLSPVLSLSWSIAVAIFAFTNIAILFVASFFLWKILSPNDARWWIPALLAATFFPATLTIHVGQISNFLLLSLAVLWCGVQHERPFVAGLGIAGLSLKPHLCYLIVLVLFWEKLRDRKWRNSLIIATPSLLLILGTMWFDRRLTSEWLAQLTHPSVGIVSEPPAVWLSASLPGIVRSLLQTLLGTFTTLPSLFIPVVTAVTTLGMFSLRRRFTLQSSMPTVLLINILTTPYGWAFDLVLLLPLQFATFANALTLATKPRLFCILALFTVQGLAFLWSTQPAAQHQHYFFFSVAVGLLWWFFGRTKNYSSNIPCCEPPSLGPLEA